MPDTLSTAIGCGDVFSMELGERERLARRLFDDVMTGGRLEVLDEIVHPSTVQSARAAVSEMRTAFPDARVTVDQFVSDNVGVAALLSVEATHRGVWCGLQPTGTRVAYQFAYFMRVQDGLLLEPSGVMDRLRVWEQLRPSRRHFYAQWWGALAAAAGVGVLVGRAFGA